jgi:hypothetical protein
MTIALQMLGETTMATTNTAHRQIVRLSFEDGQVVVTPKDRSTFVLSAEKAVEVCRDAVRRSELFEVFESRFLIPLHNWCLAHQDRVSACYIPFPGSHIQVFIVTNSPAFDFDLAEEVAALELELARGGWRVGVSQLPSANEEPLATFFKPEGALEVYAQGEPSSNESGK